MSQIKYSCLVLIHGFLLQTATCTQFAKWMRWNETNVTFGTPNITLYATSLIKCLLMCRNTSDCAAIHMNQANSICELSTYYPPDGTLLATPRIGWTVYYKELTKGQGFQAWQSSTYADCVADNAIDGKLDEYFCPFADDTCGCRCARTLYRLSPWVMEFKTSGSVKAALPYFRVQVSAYLYRNTNFTIFVHNSFEEGKTRENGTVCTTFTGTPTKSQVMLYCPKTIFGKAMRIEYLDTASTNSRIQLCEMEVFFL